MHFLLTGFVTSSKIGDCPYFPSYFPVPIFLFSETSLLIATIILGLLLIRPLPRQTESL